jgi:hypothetical protein
VRTHIVFPDPRGIREAFTRTVSMAWPMGSSTTSTLVAEARSAMSTGARRGAWPTACVSSVGPEGSNAYPDHLGREHELDMPADFQLFLSAVSDLVGQRVGY